ncbi:MAG: hypothetical protein L6Q98_07260 [Anaerolineae bacterium]|nr:hypothetical protein [Anaerolineae bacterium]NUQ06573.1 hypothetical protein [Anaerolineae bacterium]
MKTLELRLTVTPDGHVILPPMPQLRPGDYDAVLIVEGTGAHPAREPLQLPVIDVGPWPADLSLRREDLYDDRN